MAANANRNSMAAAILASVSNYGYKEMVPYINERDATSLNAYKTTKLAEYFTIDTSCAFKNGRANPNHIFELFGDFGEHNATQVRLLLLQHIARLLLLQHIARDPITVEIKTHNDNIFACALYRPPNTKEKEFIKNYKRLLNKFNCKQLDRLILGSDHNMDFLKHENMHTLETS